MPSPPLRAGDIVRIRDERWTVSRHIPHAAASIVEVHGCDRHNRGVRTRFVLPFEPLQRLSLLQAPRVVRPRRWRHLARQALVHAMPSYDALRTAARADISILPFQLEPALAVARGAAARLLIADDVGLGKTIQAGLIVAETFDRGDDAHVLIVAPAGLREQWAGELRSRYGLSPALLDSGAIARGGFGVVHGANPWASHPLIIASIDYVKRPEVMRALETLVWDLVVFDEAHVLSGRSDRSAAASALAERARTLVMLTATPHSGDDEVFARLCRIGDLGSGPKGGFPLAVFRRTRGDVGLSSARRTTWLRVRPTESEADMHRALMAYARLVWHQRDERAAARLAMMVLARRACSSASSLARSVERRLDLLAHHSPGTLQLELPLGDALAEDDEPAAELTAPGLDDADEEVRRLEHILFLARRVEGAESKVRAIRRILRRTGERAIVFTEYRDTLTRLEAQLHDVETARLHGGLSTCERNEAVRQFTSGDARVLLATDAASEGLNLQQRCRLVINLELPWTPLRLEQRAGRVERIGQRRRVHVVHMVAAGTSEETTVATLVRRMERVRRALVGMHGRAIRAQDVGRCVLADAPIPSLQSPAGPLPSGVTVLDLRTTATAEAERLTLARRLAEGSTDSPGQRGSTYTGCRTARPFATRLRRRTGGSRSYWAFWLELTDAELQIIWETLVGVSADVEAPPASGAGDLRRWVDASCGLLTDVLEREALVAVDRLSAAMKAPLALAARREHAVMAAATARHARIAATLLQPALFDRRSDRAAAAQAEALRETVARCTACLDAIARRQHVVAGRPTLAFAVMTG